MYGPSPVYGRSHPIFFQHCKCIARRPPARFPVLLERVLPEPCPLPPRDPPAGPQVDGEVVMEFGGPLGCLCIMLLSPVLMYYFWACLGPGPSPTRRPSPWLAPRQDQDPQSFLSPIWINVQEPRRDEKVADTLPPLCRIAPSPPVPVIPEG